ncbi:hypothetical protein ABAC460_11255 [Asticcacaulis sp. AC460]|uniref:hypothetical protein n=1 Tax=Asticcacaulis sp. AC460 TaxID=1282360 RepID=UPI0003C3E0AA|nr:hypothetical protein [Asticcacaulis sp. AC460]ESQ89872.1 hypothetical protein ABAC460_11255 [Asticcacaulis sp. AC460]
MALLRAFLTAGTFLLSAVAAHAGDVTCSDYTFTVADAETPVAITVPVEYLVAQCTSASGATLYIVSPSDGIALTLEPHTQATVTFTVQNAEGAHASADVHIKRN